MDRIIEVKVGGNHLSKDNKNAGVRGEANVTKLRITFDEGWNSYTKKITFWNARGLNPVVIDLLPHLAENETTYLVPIPAEPMEEAGAFTFVIEGTVGEKVQRSLSDKLEVKDAPVAQNAGQPVPPTEDELTQLGGEIEKIKSDILDARNSKDEAKTYRDEAKVYRDDADAKRWEARSYRDEAIQKADEAEQSATRAEEALGKTNYIGDNGNWYAWDSVEGVFYDTSVKAQAGSTVYLGDNPPPDADVWVDPDGDEYISHSPILRIPFEDDNGADEEYWYVWDDVSRKYVNTGVKAQGEQGDKGDTPIKGVDYWNSEDIEEIQGYIDEKTEIIRSDMEGLQAQLNEEAHFRGYLSTNAKVKALKATPNDFAYSAESGTKWVYDAENGWQDTENLVPDQLTPASNATPLVNGEASAGRSNEYARGDHRHPTDTTRASVEALNNLRDDMYHLSIHMSEEIENIINWNKSDTLEFFVDIDDLHTLNNCSVAPFSALNLYGGSWQDETPTPNEPSYIGDCTGSNLVVTDLDGPDGDNWQWVEIPYQMGGIKDTNGNWVARDEIVVDGINKKVKHIQRVEYAYLDGSTETWIVSDSHFILTGGASFKASYPNALLCSHYPVDVGHGSVATMSDKTVSYANTFYGGLTFYDTTYTTFAEWKANLAENPIQVVGVRTKPIETDITNTATGQDLLGLHTFYKDTIVLNESGADCTFTYTADLSIAYNQLLDRVVALETAAVNNI